MMSNTISQTGDYNMLHSSIVGGSTAKRVINCPASVKLVAKMPPKPSSVHADRGTLLHDAIANVLNGQPDVIGTVYEGITLTQELYDEKIVPALAALDEIDVDGSLEYVVESRVGFGTLLPGVFGSSDLLGRIGDRAIVLDWKFGDGVVVDAVENDQGMFYAAAAMRTPEANWVFEGATEIEIIIVQPPVMRRWVTTPERIKQFERDLVRAVKESETETTPVVGDHCRWCAAKPVCPAMTGALDRFAKTSLESIDAKQIGHYLQQADTIEDFIKSVRELAFQMLESDVPVPGYKLVAKRGTRQWVDEVAAEKFLGDKAFEKKLISVAQAEKLVGKKNFPSELAVSVSSGSTLANEDDPRPAILNIGKQLTSALSKL
jgi:hypothetical protein